MAKRTRKIVLGIMALAALALGGSALAQAGNTPAKPKAVPAVKSQTNKAAASPADTDSVQSGDQSTPDSQQGSEQPEGKGEASGESKGEESGSETPNDDGPGGHADEPANPNADHQFEGKE